MSVQEWTKRKQFELKPPLNLPQQVNTYLWWHPALNWTEFFWWFLIPIIPTKQQLSVDVSKSFYEFNHIGAFGLQLRLAVENCNQDSTCAICIENLYWLVFERIAKH